MSTAPTQRPGGSRAVLYLRVSSDGQVKTDYDPEGISIPAQREVCERKARALGFDVVGEYVEPGRSATSMDKRIAFQQMLARIKTDKDVDYVIVYKLSRMNRNRIEDALVVDKLQRSGVTLISATEAIDDSRNGRLLHGILAAINEFRSAEDGADIRDKMAYKARNGGTLGRAPLGYRNVRIDYEGRQINTVEIDSERAPLVRQAWELYATGDYTLEDLSEVMADRGLLTRATVRRPSQPVSKNKFAQMFRDVYYLGKIDFQGVIYDGRHEAIVTQDLYDRVQDILDARQQRNTRSRVHHHYLKGMLFCDRCHQAGRLSRLIYTEAKSHNGALYQYFKCRGTQDGTCDLRHLPVWLVEDKIVDHYSTLQLPQDFIDLLDARITEALQDEGQMTKRAHESLRAQQARLDIKEERLLDMVEEAAVSRDKVRARLAAIRAERDRITQSLLDTSAELSTGAQHLRDALDLIRDPQALYQQAPDEARRHLNLTFYERFYLDLKGETNADLREPFQELHDTYRAYHRQLPVRSRQTPQRERHPETGVPSDQTPSSNPSGVYPDGIWSKRVLVDLRREFENPCPHLKTLSLRRSRGFYNHDQRSSEPTVSDSRGRMVRSLGMAQTLLRPEQVDDLVAQYREGATLVELASRFGVNRRTVAMHLTRREVTIRRGRFDPSRIHEAADLYLNGLTLVEVGVKVGVGPQAVRQALASHGVVIRPGGRRGSRITAAAAVGG